MNTHYGTNPSAAQPQSSQAHRTAADTLPLFQTDHVTNYVRADAVEQSASSRTSSWFNVRLPTLSDINLSRLNPLRFTHRQNRADYRSLPEATLNRNTPSPATQAATLQPTAEPTETARATALQQRNASWVCSTGMLCDFFNLAMINTAKPLMRTLHGKPTPLQESMVSSASLAGAVLGQSLLGSLADKIGRKPASLIAAGLSTMGALGSALAGPWNTHAGSIYDVVALTRLITGIGAGGDFPILASITAENAPPENSANALIRNSIMAALGATVTQITYATLIPNTDNETAWRTAAGIATLLSIGTLVARQLLLPNQRTEQNTATTATDQTDVDLEIPNLDTVTESPSTQSDTSLAPLLKPILATASAWIIYDFVDFSLTMYSSDILGSPSNPEQGALMTMALNSTALLGALAAMKLVDPTRLGRNNLQTLGFTGLAASHLLLAATSGHLWQDNTLANGARQVSSDSALGRATFLTLYGLQQLFDAVGPAVCVYLIPAEIFPTAMRSTCMGIAAATGKLGAVLGSAAMPFIRDAGGLPTVFLATGILSTLGAVITRQFIPHYGPDTIARLDTTQAREGAEGVAKILYPPKQSDRAVLPLVANNQ